MENIKTETENKLKRDYMRTAEKINDAANEATGSAAKSLKAVQDYCRENPGQAVGIALGVGALASLLLVKAFSRRESPAERVLTNVLRTGERVWGQMRDGVNPAVRKIQETLRG